MKKGILSSLIGLMLLAGVFGVSAFAAEATNYYDGVTLTAYYDYISNGVHYITISPGESFTFANIDLTDGYKSVVIKQTRYFYDEYHNLVASDTYYYDDVNGGWTNECWAMQYGQSFYTDYVSNYAANFLEMEVRVYDTPMVYWSPDLEYDLPYTSYTANYYLTYEASYTAPTNLCYPSNMIVQLDNWDTDLWDYFYKTVDANGGVTNYIRIRDLAAILDGTNAQFDVRWNSTYGVSLYTDSPYDSRNGTEFDAPFYGNQYYQVNTKPTLVDLNSKSLKSIILTDSGGGGHTYYQLRDIGRYCGFNVSWINGQIVINTNQAYSDYA